jgi:two-component system nitrate/nitrite response regulator NarL
MKFLLIDDHALFRQGLLLLLQQLPGEHRFLEADNCEDAFAVASAHQDIDLILLDLALPGINGLDGMVRLQNLCSTTPIVLISATESSSFIVDGMRRGAQGFIPKSASPEVMTAALQVILAGGTYVPAQGVLPQNTSLDERRNLTERQQEVLALIAQQLSNKEIATALGMRVNTVRVHVAAILDALGVDNRVEAARVALSQGWVANGR